MKQKIIELGGHVEDCCVERWEENFWGKGQKGDMSNCGRDNLLKYAIK